MPEAEPAAEEPPADELPARDPGTRRWLFADQLGPHFLDTADQPVLLVESLAALRRSRVHRRKAHLVLSALRHRAAELGGRAELVRAGTYAEALARAGVGAPDPVSVCDPTSWGARRLVRRLDGVRVLASRGFVVSEPQFARWARGRGGRRLLMEDFYRDVRRHHGLLLDARGGPVGGRWNYDEDNREPPPRRERLAVADPWWPQEDEIDAGVREDLDRVEREHGPVFAGDDGPRRFAATRAEALTALEHFLAARLDAFGPHEDAMLAADPWMAHSMLSAPLNLGLLDPLEVARRAEQVGRARVAHLPSLEGFVRQVVGWRSWVWHLHWHLGEDHVRSNALGAREPLPDWFERLDPHSAVGANCLAHVLRSVRQEGWTHHVPRLVVLGGWALQRGYDPAALAEWFRRSFVDGYEWVMTTNVVGISQHADGGASATKPYTTGGAYVDRMSDFCRGCRYDPAVRVGERACPYTAGYWAFLHRHRERLAANPRMVQPLRGLDRLPDLEPLLQQEARRGAAPP
ncbi:cryptochrome/photolyase family protein [Kineococcus glutinatus]|uniref:cryptochrome/photolyase family protein n=1 Tax=Kineococcus glutinatus TaxID=1070872 RepID=UPI0031ED15B1